MYALWVTIKLKPQYHNAYIVAIVDDAQSSLQNEQGCLRFEVMRDEEDPNRFQLLEVYRDKAAFETHTKTPHFQRYRQTVTQDWFAEPPVVRRCSAIFPPPDAWR